MKLDPPALLKKLDKVVKAALDPYFRFILYMEFKKLTALPPDFSSLWPNPYEVNEDLKGKVKSPVRRFLNCLRFNSMGVRE